ncbi:MAG: hypothetical protein AAF266_00565 [Planctomycetota bacterium]
MSDHDEHAEHAEEAADHKEEEEEPHIALTERAFETLRLDLAPAEISDYTRTTAIPAQVAEFPGVSALKLAAPVHGVVAAVAAAPGVSVEPGDALFELQITDERVLDAQLQLLEALTRLQIVEEELDRLEPLAASGAVAGRQRRDLAYEQRELQTTIQLRRDELVVRGLPADQVAQLMEEARLTRTVVVRVPKSVEQLTDAAIDSGRVVRRAAWQENTSARDLSIENLLVQPGETVERGQTLADVAAHSRLYLRVMAFERDVPLLARLAANGTALSAEFGHSVDGHEEASSVVDGLRVRYVGNHVEPGTQTYACYVPLDNELLNEAVDPAGRRYRTWRFSVGQRAHLLLPTERIAGHFALPIDAVAVEGPNAYVFRRHEHEDETHEAAEDDHDEHEEEAYVEFEPVAVTLLHRDTRHAVVATGGDLAPGDEIAMNAAYQLLIALEADAGGGHGHHHHHDH